MKIDSNDELVEIIGEGLLWDIVGNYAETHLEFLKEALRPLGYIDYEDIDKITFAEVRESDEFIINDFMSNRRLSQVISADYLRRKYLSQSAVNEPKAFYIGWHRRLSRAYFSSAMAGLK